MEAVVVAIAGFDPISGAGLTADLLTFDKLGCYGTAVITAVTFQNTRGVSGYITLGPDDVTRQFDCLKTDCEITAVKIGMMGNESTADLIKEIASGLQSRDIPIILDPIADSGGGVSLFEGDWRLSMRNLLPYVSLVTPNSPELAAILDIDPATGTEEMASQAKLLNTEFGVSILATGGHIGGDSVTDILVENGRTTAFTGRYYGRKVHGTGCLISAAITAFISRGFGLPEAIRQAELYVDRVLENPFFPGRGGAVARLKPGTG